MRSFPKFARSVAVASMLALATAPVAFAQGSSANTPTTTINGNTTINANNNIQTALAIGNLNKVTNTAGSIHAGTTINGNTTISANNNIQTALAIGNLNEVRNAAGSIGAP